MPKVLGTHHTRLDYVSVAPYDVKTLFGIDFGPLEMAFHFFSPTSAHIVTEKDSHWEKTTHMVRSGS